MQILVKQKINRAQFWQLIIESSENRIFGLYIGLQWRNFFISYLCQLFSAILWGKLFETFATLTSVDVTFLIR